jgi:hypothetical protein
MIINFILIVANEIEMCYNRRNHNKSIKMILNSIKESKNELGKRTV